MQNSNVFIFSKEKFLWLSGIIFSLIFTFAFSAAALAADFAVVYNTDELNLRDQPSSSSQWLGAYPRGSWVEITSSSPQNWYAVRTMDGKNGYMSKNYLNVGVLHTSKIGYVNNPNSSTFTYLRSAPSYSGSVIGKYYNSVPALILNQSNGWYQVNINGTVGYMLSELMQVTTGIGSSDIATIVTPNQTPLNMRQGPSTGYSVIKQFNGGRYVMVLNRGNGWWKVAIDGQIGFMDTNFLKSGIQGSGGSLPGGGNQSGGNQSGGGNSGTNQGESYALVKNPGANQVLNLREQPDQASRSIGQYRNNTKVVILQQGVQWSKVRVVSTGKTGWMMSRYLQLYNLPGNPVKTISHPNGSFVNLRKDASMSSPVLIRLNHGTSVTVLSPGSQWTKVQYSNYVGYVMSIFLK